MKHEAPARPAPVGVNDRGNIDLYGGESLMVYRLLNGISVDAIAGYLRMTAVGARYYERIATVQEKQALAYMGAVERVVRDRARMVAEGEARRDGTYVPPAPPVSRVRWRTRAEADAVLYARRSREEAASR